MKTISIQVPDDCEVQIVKKEEPVIRTYQDLIDNRLKINGYFISGKCRIAPYNIIAQKDFSEDIAASEKVAKSMLAMAMISQIMPYYGGEITTREWNDLNIDKYFIYKCNEDIHTSVTNYHHHYLAFHTAGQRDEFLKWNLDLVKDYLMIND